MCNVIIGKWIIDSSISFLGMKKTDEWFLLENIIILDALKFFGLIAREIDYFVRGESRIEKLKNGSLINEPNNLKYEYSFSCDIKEIRLVFKDQFPNSAVFEIPKKYYRRLYYGIMNTRNLLTEWRKN